MRMSKVSSQPNLTDSTKWNGQFEDNQTTTDLCFISGQSTNQAAEELSGRSRLILGTGCAVSDGHRRQARRRLQQAEVTDLGEAFKHGDHMIRWKVFLVTDEIRKFLLYLVIVTKCVIYL